MQTLTFVWGFIAFSILGSEFFIKTETFDALQDFESNFNVVGHPEEFLPNWSANEVRGNTSRVFQAAGEGLNNSKALGIQPISSFNAEIYTKSTSIGLESNRISLQAKTNRNGSGNRPLYVFYSFSVDEGDTFTEKHQLGDNDSFQNENSPYREYEFLVPDTLLEKESLFIKLEVHYGEGNGSAARLFIDDFMVHGLAREAQVPLDILSVEVNEGKILVVHFNQPIQFTEENVKNPFLLNHTYGSPEKVMIEDQLLYLEFSDYLYSNRYELTLNHLISEDGEEIWMDRRYVFDINTPTPPGSILINEFMPDPNPKGLVPEDAVIPSSASHEYIELYNTANKPISLDGFSYNDGNFEGFILTPGAYVLLTGSGNKDLFSPFGEAIGVSPFSSLANSAGHISIKDALGNVVDSLSYNLDWYLDLQKTRGGWALERKNPFQACSDMSNWMASTSMQGGTPGKINAVFDTSTDTRPFNITQIQPTSNRELRVLFSKPLNEEGIQNATFIMEGAILVVKESYFRGLTLTLPEDLVPDRNYFLEVQNLYDCSGVLLQEEPFPFIYDLEVPKILRVAGLSPEEIRVFFNESVSSSTSELEENYLLDKNTGLVQSAQLTDSLSVLLKLKNPLKIDQHYSLTIFNLEDAVGNIAAEETVNFLFDDKLDTIMFSGTSILDLYFKTEVDSLSTSAIFNYSVDGNVGHPQSAFRNAENFRLVHLIFDQNLPQNTRGTITVQNIQDVYGNYINTHRKTFLQDNRPLTLTKVEVINDSTLNVHFSKPLLPAFGLLKTNYIINEDIGNPLSVMLVDPQTVTLVFQKKFIEEKTYQLSVDGLRDIFGIEINGTITINFDFDLSAPAIEKAKLINPYEIKLKSNKSILPPKDTTIWVSNHEITGITSFTDTEFSFTTHRAMTENKIKILLLGLEDLRGNKADTIIINIPNDKIDLGEASIIKEDMIQLTFSAEVDPANSLQPTNYLVNGQPPHEVILGENPYELLLHLQKPLTLDDSVGVEIKTIKSREGKENQGLVENLWYDDGIEDLYILNPQLIQILHTTALEKAQTEKTIFTLKDQEIQLKPLVNQTDQRMLQLILNHPLIPDISYELSIPPRNTINNQILPGSSRSIILDKSPPELVMIESLSENELLVSFNEALDPILSQVTSFYHLGDTEPLEVLPGDVAHQVILVFNEIFQKDTTYQLDVVQVEDLHRNAIVEESLTFVFDGPVSPDYKDIIVNELMAAPRQGNELPDAEYIELFNAGKNEVFLGGLFLTNSRSTSVIPRESILPGTYLILTPANRKEEMEQWGRTIGLSNWPTLLNDGDEIKLLNRNGNVLDELSYNNGSYGSSEKAQGGYSLEVVNPFSFCPEPGNLRPSNSLQRGTPGKVNSVFDATPDQSQVALLKAYPKGIKTIEMEFSKILNNNLSLVEITAIPFLEIQSLAIDEEYPYRLIIELREPLQENQLYQISIDHLRDCAGNLIDPARNTASFKIPVPADLGDILLNEVLFNPRTGGSKFVEIYNRSDKFISLINWKLANASNGEVSNRKVLSSNDLIIDPFSFMVFTTDASMILQEYPKSKPETFIELSSLPGYPISRGAVILLNPEEDLIEWFDYDEKFHHALLDDVKGISLERYSLDHHTNESKNWHSASSSEGYATPGYRNSQINPEGVLQKGITISPKVFVPNAPGEQNFTTINYEMNSPGFVGTLRIYSIGGQLIKELCQNELWGSSGFYTWDGTGLSGKMVRPGYYIVWVEVLNLEGQVENIKKTVVVGSKF